MEKEIFTHTFCSLRSKLHLVAERLLRDEMDAEDAVQDTFCNLWVAGKAETDAEARNKLFVVLKNVCLNKLKRKRPVSGVETLEIPVEPNSDVDSEFIRVQLLNCLTPVQKQVFGLSVYDDMEYDEIALKLGISIDAVRMHMCRARKILREQYKKMNL